MNYKLSDFCHFIDGDHNLVALYNALTLGMVIVDKNTASFLHKKKDSVISFEESSSHLEEQLLGQKIIFPLGKRQDIDDYLQIQEGLSIKRIGILYLILNDACNINCKYCFIENEMPSNYVHKKMLFEVAKRGIDLFVKTLQTGHHVTEPQIILYGGEPFTNPKVIREIIEYISRLKKTNCLPSETSITINTNGTLIDTGVIDILKGAENLNIAISIDGPKEIHDYSRPYYNGAGTFDDIMSGYDLLLKNNITAGFCCTINKYNIDKLKDIAKWFVNEMKAKSLGFNILIESQGIENIRGDSYEYSKKVAEKIVECFKYFREKGVHEDRIMRKVNSFVDGTIYYYDCGGCGQQIVVTPDNMIGVCQGYCSSKKHFVKLDNEFDPLKHQIWEKWRYRSPLFMSQCKNCIALSVCGGGCPYSAEKRNGDIYELDDVFCVHAKYTTEYLIKDLLKQYYTDDKI